MNIKLSPRAWVILALSLLAALTYGAFARDWILTDAPLEARVVLKTAGVALLALLAWSEKSSPWLVGGLALGALGDGLLVFGGPWFIVGAAAFLIGHALYTTLFLRAGIGLRASFQKPWRAIAISEPFFAAWLALYLLWPTDPAAAPGALIYTAALAIMFASSFTLPLTRVLVMIGAGLFFLSDVLLTWNMNRPPSDPLLARIVSDASWFTYYFGQLGICLGALDLQKGK